MTEEINSLKNQLENLKKVKTEVKTIEKIEPVISNSKTELKTIVYIKIYLFRSIRRLGRHSNAKCEKRRMETLLRDDNEKQISTFLSG